MQMRTVLALQTTAYAVCLLVIVVLWRQNRGRFAGLSFLAASFAAQTIADVLLSLRGSIPDWQSVVLADVLVISGTLLLILGLERFLQRPGRQVHNYALLALFAVVHWHFTFAQPNITARFVNTSAALLILCSQGVWLLTRRAAPALRQAAAGTALVLAGFCTLSIVRIVAAAFGPLSRNDFFAAGGFQISVVVAYQALVVLLTFSLVLLVNGRLVEEIRSGEEKYAKAFRSSPYAILLTRRSDGRAIEVNDAFEKLSGYAAGEVVGKTASELQLWQRPEDGAALERAITASGGVRDAEHEFRMKSGEVRTGLVSIDIIELDGEHLLLSSINDITERRRAEEVLRQSEWRFRAVLETMPLIGLMMDRAGRITHCNDFLLALTGWTRNELTGRSWFEACIPPEIRHDIAQLFGEAIAAGTMPAHYENEIATRTGERRQVRWNNMLLHDHSGAVIAVASIGEDITALARPELERHVMRDIAQSIATSTNLDELLAGMHRALRQVLKAENCFVALHDEATGLFSFPFFVDQHDQPPPPVAMPASCTAYVLRHGEPALITPAFFRQLQAQGDVALVGAPSPSWMGVPLRTPSGIIGVLVVQEYDTEDCYNERDLQFLAAVGSQVAIVIERTLAQDALRVSEAELNVILESTADGMLAVDITGRVLRTNRRFATMWRIPASVAASRDDAQLLQYVLNQLTYPEEFLAKVQDLYHSMAESRDKVYLTDGRVFERYSAPILARSAIAGRVWSFHDATERERNEETRAALEAQLQHAQKMESVGRLAGGVAHEFNNMLSVILGFTELSLHRVDASQPVYANLLEIQKAAQHSADITRQLLAYARKQTVQPIMLDLNEAVANLLAMLRRLIGENIQLVWRPAGGLWPVMIDPFQLQTVLTSLCLSARDAIAGVGTIALTTANCTLDAAFCGAHPDAVPGGYVRITVHDTGSGMDAATLDHVFEPFFTTKGLGEGIGLGLPAVYGAVKQHGGFVAASSVPGQGTTLEVYLPRQVVEVKPVRPAALAATAPHGQETILVVEDERAVLHLTTHVLQQQGYVVLAASSPSEAIRLEQEHPGEIHLLLSDVVMPGMSGRDLATLLLPLRPQLRQLFMSGHTADVIANRGLLDAGVSFIQKPYSIAALTAKVREVLDSTVVLSAEFGPQ